MNVQDALRSPAARKERRTSLVIGAVLIGLGSSAEPLYRAFDGPLLGIRLLWCAVLAAVGLALPRASTQLCGVLLPLAGLASCWLFAVTVWLNGGLASPDFEYTMLLPLVLMVLFQDEVIACAAAAVATISGVAVLSWLGDAPLAATVDRLSVDATVGVLAVFGALSFRRVRLAELATQRARTEAVEQLAFSERRRAQAERLASLGQLAAGVAHEINNPLSAVTANIELLAAEPGLDVPDLAGPEVRGAIEDIQHGLGRISQIVRDLRDYARGGSDELQPCQIDEVIGDALRLASFKLGKAIEVRRCCEHDLPPVTVHRGRLSQVLLNLLVNAAEAMEEARTHRPWVRIAAARAGTSVEIAVEDNGIAAAVAPRLFEPFVTSKPIGKGTGLGLALSREYVASFGGTLELQPTPGAGARFAIVLPMDSAIA
jgi:C4-dicarboxylate-specific signal transduction histidine kinase